MDVLLNIPANVKDARKYVGSDDNIIALYSLVLATESLSEKCVLSLFKV